MHRTSVNQQLQRWNRQDRICVLLLGPQGLCLMKECETERRCVRIDKSYPNLQIC